MSTKDQKSAPELAFRDGQGGNNPLRDGFSQNEFTTLFTNFQGNGRVWPLLGIGADNALSRSKLAEVLQVTERDVRRLVSRERRAGLPICSSVERMGYYRPATLGDVEMVERSMRRRARETAAVADALRRSLDEMSGQERIEEVLDG